MKAIQITGYGDTDVIRVAEVDRPAVTAGAVLVKVEKAGVNYLDIQVRRGMYGIPTPFITGFEGAGVVVEVGEGVEGLAPGQRVVWSNVLGSAAEYVVVPAELANPIPDEISTEDAAAAQVQGITAQYLVTDVHAVAPGETVVVHAAAGGVGGLITQFATSRGATVIATASSPEKQETARRLGADHVTGYAGLLDTVREVTGGRGADVVFDGVGPATIADSIEALRIRGTLALYGESSGPLAPLDLGGLEQRSLTLVRPSFGHYTATPEEVRARTQAVHAAIRDGVLSIAHDASLTLDDAAEAQSRLQDRRTRGKILLTVA